MAVGLFAIFGLSQIVLETLADARAGGGRAGGFRGSRSYQAPSKPANPSQPQRAATPQQVQQPSPMMQSGGFMRGIGTAMLGGFLGSMLFSGLASAAGMGGLGGGYRWQWIWHDGNSALRGLGVFLYRKYKSSQAAAAPGYGSMQYQDTLLRCRPGRVIPILRRFRSRYRSTVPTIAR